MDVWTIRAGIFLVTGLVIFIFPRQVMEWQFRTTKQLNKIFRWKGFQYLLGVSKTGVLKSNKIFAVLSLIISALLFWIYL